MERMRDKNQMNIFDYPEAIPDGMRKGAEYAKNRSTL